MKTHTGRTRKLHRSGSGRHSMEREIRKKDQ